MSHQSLYRKYRPQSFSEISGQDHVVKALQGAITNETVSHAYLFSGSRGTGKTSIARIFARELGTTEDDIYEVDAASNNGVDEIRELAEAVFTLPFRSQYKVYILDEVHMFSKSAWNAFLKTLEEPPSHVIFILATTELEKVPETILSRCQSFVFKKPSRVMLREVIERAGKSEGVKLEEGVADLIALFGDGAFRDAYGTLEKLIGSKTDGKKDTKITRAEAEEILGAPKEELLLAYVSGLVNKDAEACLTAVRTLGASGADTTKAFELIIERFRALLLLAISPSSADTLSTELSEKTYDTLQALVKAKSPLISSATLIKLLDAYGRVKTSPMPELPLEIVAVEIVQ